eukprot:CAMPEP_0176498374 /NCGR_PEP_ID=MMETSP0200_2-20121128/12282_1 /TAXON_ID=947934 /ORGANISM="Chaetoceros sp., Strain GSL56" /LENGTH=1374 /DNA_ID=CAMNT_0017896567 /DNA_START=206 /DNA_END=4326 /DNA_ORIENTATION=+
MASFNDKSWAIRSSTIPKEAVDKEFSNLFITANKNDCSDVDGASNDVSSPGPNMAPFIFKTMHDTGSLHSRRSIYSSTTDANYTYSTVKPLSWREARMKLCDILKSYVSSSRGDMILLEKETQVVEILAEKKKLTNLWFFYNFDCYFGSIICSLALLILSVTLYIRHEQDESDLTTYSRLYQSHITASTLLLAGSILSAWLIRRRRISNARGAETKKRNTIETFLPVLEELINCKDDDVNTLADEERKSFQKSIPGTSLTDIYPVYRLHGDGRRGTWHKIPSLLLVEGDFIALQLGDTAPADCVLVTGSKLGSSAPRNLSAPNLRAMATSAASSFQSKMPQHREQVVLKAGDRVELSPRLKFENRGNIQLCDPLFLPGKSKIAEHSKKLLHLTNHSKVFKVVKSPIITFLRKKTGKSDFPPNVEIWPFQIRKNYHKLFSSYSNKVPKTLPLIQRKLSALRKSLFGFCVIILVLSYIVIFIRHGIDSLNISTIIHLPLVAVLGSLPVMGPFIVIVLEIIGTSQILVVVHPYSSNVKKIQSKCSLLWKYVLRGLDSRLELGYFTSTQDLLDFPVASTCLYEKLGVVTALSLIDDELACDPVSTPQQLLIPTNNGLKLLDLFPKYEQESDDERTQDDNHGSIRKRAKSFASSHDSDSEWGDEPIQDHKNHNGYRMRSLVHARKRFLKTSLSKKKLEPQASKEVQFEEPTWWHYLPSLKCIGLAGLLIDNKGEDTTNSSSLAVLREENNYSHGEAESSLVHHVSQYYDRSHLRILSKCIGFSAQPNSFGPKGDISPFQELRRIRIIATRLLYRRMILDRHQISLEESRSWGLLRPDCTSVVVKDARTQAYNLLTAGDARVVTDICSDTWQGETITPLSAIDRATILENSKNWSLADLDVTAFSYAPIPYTYDKKFAVQNVGMRGNAATSHPTIHLIDNRMSGEVPATLHKESGSEDWSLVKNQIFLGLLGSSVRPRRDVAPLIEDCASAGVRFIYFSPRNMRRTKELASQMGIDISWNCAISLRPLDEGEEADKHRMTSNYADWDVNARLPHGVEAVKRHLQDVDNVPLLVSLFTDVTRSSTSEMVKVFQCYNDTILSVGLSHICQNDDTFIASDIAFGNDIFFGDQYNMNEEDGLEMVILADHSQNALCRRELLFVSKVASNSCVFNLCLGQNGLLNMAEILAQGRKSLASGVSAVTFLLYSSIVCTLTIFSCIFSASTSMPLIPTSLVALYLMVFIPAIAISMQFSNQNETLMTSVPPKNDKSITFASGEYQRIIFHMILRSIIPVTGSQLVFLIAFGSYVLEYDPDTIELLCNLDSNDSIWTSAIRCPGLSKYLGQASMSASCLMLSELNLCVILQSMSFLFGNDVVANPVAKNW